MPRHTWELLSREKFNGRVNYTVKCSNCNTTRELTGVQFHSLKKCSCDQDKNKHIKIRLKSVGLKLVQDLDNTLVVDCVSCGKRKFINRPHFRERIKYCACTELSDSELLRLIKSRKLKVK